MAVQGRWLRLRYGKVGNVSHLFVDGHVHFYPCFQLAEFLDSAARNLGAAGATGADNGVGCLLLAAVGEDALSPAIRRYHESLVGEWSIEPTGEEGSFVARRSGWTDLFLIPGRQIRTRENLEVLALCSPSDAADGLPIDETIAVADGLGAVVAIPWGAGKWLGSRGRAVRSVLDGELATRVNLGDNAGRPRWSGEPSLFRLAAERGIPVLPGSDPLPFASEATRIGGYGFRLDGAFDPDQPGASIKALLDRRVFPEAVGGRIGIRRFVANQLALILRKGGSAPMTEDRPAGPSQESAL